MTFNTEVDITPTNPSLHSVAELVAIGGKHWTAPGKERVYFNDLCGLYGLKIWRYNTGNISSALLDGEKISNTRARKLWNYLVSAKLCFDLVANSFSSRLSREDHAHIVSAIQEKLSNRK